MAANPSSFHRAFSTSPWPKPKRCPAIRSHRFKPEDSGNSANNNVDANLSILRCRIEEIRRKERPNNSYMIENGWNFRHGCDDKHQKSVTQLLQFFEVIASVGTTLTLVTLAGSILIFFYSLVIHMVLH